MKIPVIQHQLLNEKRSVTYSILFKVWLLVAVYAVLHDQYIVRIAPEHFTIYHDPLLGIEHPATLAAVYAFGASFSPGLLLGFSCAVFARGGSLPKLSVKCILIGVIAVIILTELSAAFSGFIVYKSGSVIYPESWYPSHSLRMMVTQTIQVTCYIAAAVLSVILLVTLLAIRYKNKPNKAVLTTVNRS
ncbi:hypothetical protein NT6N_24580 [Oceaniferula spumae]|uniref:Uncharacterized protein n=1 Tax=Oceaniferula spumae TaxID=2979115 RepID=A0AAT9FN68_9BACT